MIEQSAAEPVCPSPPTGPEVVLLPRAHDIGGFEVRRALPARERQMVGPFIFFDQMGPGEFLAGRGLDVRPHPHIGLATVTYLFEGEILHRDSLGSRQPIVPGDVNWMTAGRGIAHSERTDQDLRNHANRLFGIQSWVALPQAAEETAPAFVHHPAATLPLVEDGGVRLRLIAGAGWGLSSPVADLLAAVLRRCGAGAGRGGAAARGIRGARRLCRAGRGRCGRRPLRTRPHAGVPCRGPAGAARRAAGRSDPAAGRCGDGRTASSVLELRLLQPRADRAGQGRLEGGRFGKVAGDDAEYIPLPQ